MSAPIVSAARVPVAEDQIVTDEMLTNMGIFAQGSLDSAIQQFLNGGVCYTGLQCAIATNPNGNTASLVSIQPGSFWRGGVEYPLRDVTSLDLSNVIALVPDSTKSAIVLILADGSEGTISGQIEVLDEAQKPADPNAYQPTKIIQGDTAVVRQMNPAKRWGDPALQPQAPSFPANYCLIATAVVDNGSVVSVVQEASTQITRVDQLAPIVAYLQKLVASQQLALSGLQSGLDALTAADTAKFASFAAELAALKQLLNNLGTQQVVQASGGSVYTVVDYFLDDSLSTPSGPNYNAATGSGLTFPATNTGNVFAPTNPYATGLSLIGTKLTVAYTESLSGGTPGDTIAASYAYMNSFPTLSGGTQQRGFGVYRLRYGAAFGQEATTQLMVSGDPTRIFAVKPSDLPYDPSWDGWTKYNPELVHQAGYWSDLTSRGYWTPRTPGAPVTGQAGLSQYTVPRSTFMLTRFDLAIVKGSRGDMRMIVCDDIGGAPDFSRVLSDVTVNYSDIEADKCSFRQPYPILQKQGKPYHLWWGTTGDHRIRLAPPVAAGGSSQLNGQILAPGPNGGWFKYSNSAEVGAQYFQATFYQQDIAPIPLTPFFQAGGADTLDLVTPAIVPDGCAIQYGMYRSDNSFQPLGPVSASQPNLLAQRPTNVAVFMNLLGGNNVRPIIDLGTSASGAAHVATAKQAGDFLNESDTRLVPNGGTVTTITETVILKGFNPALHTFSELLEVGASFATTVPPSNVSAPVVQADGTTVITTTWTGFAAPLSTWRLRRVGHTSDSQQPFKVVQASMTAK